MSVESTPRKIRGNCCRLKSSHNSEVVQLESGYRTHQKLSGNLNYARRVCVGIETDKITARLINKMTELVQKDEK